MSSIQPAWHARNLPYRQVHLDFHTSGSIRDVGKAFSRRNFIEALRAGCVNSINLFSKCHHGYSYHETDVGQMHPGLGFNLLEEMLSSCRENGIGCPIYLSAGLDELYGSRHPDHRWVGRQGDNPLRAGWRKLCFNTPYLDYLCAQIEEVVRRFSPEGVWLDITKVTPCFCEHCLREMRSEGLDPARSEDAWLHADRVQRKYLERTSNLVRKLAPRTMLFHNAGHVAKGDRGFLRYTSHIELESLPTGGWGYDHFPLSARYAVNFEEFEMIGMTGKFHTHWGEFGGFKHPNALRLETSLTVTEGARCCIGDQLHPSGRMDRDTYALIGEAYRYIESIEPYLRHASPVSDIAVLSEEAATWKLLNRIEGKADKTPASDRGAGRMFMETQELFRVIDLEHSLSEFKVVVLPDTLRVDEVLARKLRSYLRNGGRLLLSHVSGLQAHSDRFALPGLGTVKRRSDFQSEYIRLLGPLNRAARRSRLWIPESPILITGGALLVKPAKNARCLAEIEPPYFNRSRLEFCSHLNAPPTGATIGPAIIATDRVVWFSHPVFGEYARTGQRLHRDIVRLAMDRLLEDRRTVEVELPSGGRINLFRQSDKSRYILHLAYGNPVKRGGEANPSLGLKDVEVIEDLPPLHDVKVGVRLPEFIRAVRIAPSEEELPLLRSGGRVRFTVPRVECHQIVILDYAEPS